MRKKPIKTRIIEAYNGLRIGDYLTYENLAHIIFPAADYPNAWRYSQNGGPPGCYMALSAALNRLGIHISYQGKQRIIYKPRIKP